MRFKYIIGAMNNNMVEYVRPQCLQNIGEYRMVGGVFIGSNVVDTLLSRADVIVISDKVNDYYDVKMKEGALSTYGN